jgi:hypothetical protein
MTPERAPLARKHWPWMPDFFIVGAMKCGTSTLHAMLAEHPQVFIPDGEVFFFDIDDFQNHVNFFAYDGSAWGDLDFEANVEEYGAWYARFFAKARPGQMIGEDSTTYLASARAAPRIARFNPDAKILVMLRDPASRTYSNYWHLLRYGRALFDFEDCLRLQPESLIARSLYTAQVENYLAHFPRAQLRVVLLEELMADPRAVLAEVCAFLGLQGGVPESAFARHENRGDAPRSLPIAYWRNRLLWRVDADNFLNHLPRPVTPVRSWFERFPLRFLNRLHGRINPLDQRPPPMKPGTRRFLNQMFRRENARLAGLIGKDLNRWWYRDH